jgi:hypothetical protein
VGRRRCAAAGGPEGAPNNDSLDCRPKLGWACTYANNNELKLVAGNPEQLLRHRGKEKEKSQSRHVKNRRSRSAQNHPKSETTRNHPCFSLSPHPKPKTPVGRQPRTCSSSTLHSTGTERLVASVSRINSRWVGVAAGGAPFTDESRSGLPWLPPVSTPVHSLLLRLIGLGWVGLGWAGLGGVGQRKGEMSSQKQPHQNQDGKHHNHQDRSGGPADFFSAMSEKHSASAAEHFPRRQRGGGPLLMKGFRVRSVDAYDGQLIRSNGRNLYSLSSYLGGGVAGVVYQALDLQAKEEVAVKVLNPVGYKLLSSAALQRCVVLKKGQPVTQDVKRMGQEHVWWLRHPNSRQLIAAYKEPRYGSLCELPLPKCIQIFGMPSGLGDGLRSGSSSPSHGPPLLVEDPSGELTDLGGLAEDVDVIPRVPPKYLQWLAARRLICQEVRTWRGRVPFSSCKIFSCC